MEDKYYFIADTHFGHKDIIKFENRPFFDTLEMDGRMIDNWNSVISPCDHIFVLGDFSFYNQEKTQEICSLLNGHKTLIMGNHDSEASDYYIRCGFDHAIEYPIIFKNFWILSHEPLYINDNMPYANIFGHVHGNTIYKDHSIKSYCVCAERINYTPISFDQIKERILNS